MNWFSRKKDTAMNYTTLAKEMDEIVSEINKHEKDTKTFADKAVEAHALRTEAEGRLVAKQNEMLAAVNGIQALLAALTQLPDLVIEANTVHDKEAELAAAEAATEVLNPGADTIVVVTEKPAPTLPPAEVVAGAGLGLPGSDTLGVGAGTEAPAPTPVEAEAPAVETDVVADPASEGPTEPEVETPAEVVVEAPAPAEEQPALDLGLPGADTLDTTPVDDTPAEAPEAVVAEAVVSDPEPVAPAPQPPVSGGLGLPGGSLGLPGEDTVTTAPEDTQDPEVDVVADGDLLDPAQPELVEGDEDTPAA